MTPTPFRPHDTSNFSTAELRSFDPQTTDECDHPTPFLVPSEWTASGLSFQCAQCGADGLGSHGAEWLFDNESDA